MLKWHRRKDICNKLGISEATLSRWFKKGLQRSYPGNGKIPFVHEDHLNAFIKKQSNENVVENIFDEIFNELS